MLDTKNFLTRVFAQRDELVISVHRPDPSGANPRGFFWNRGTYADLDLAVADVQKWDKQNDCTVYFAVAAFSGHTYTDQTTGKLKIQRKQEQATWFKALALDLDIGADKPYATQKEGWAAMLSAINKIGLPQPMVVSSGNGIHCYWTLTSPVGKDHWVKASTALRIALQENNVEIDTSKIHDPSMVLRPVGTHHKKQQPWKEVRCVVESQDYDPVTLFTVLKPWFNKLPKHTKPQTNPSKVSSIAAAVLSSNDVVLDVVAKQCKQVEALIASGGVTDAAGNQVGEPLWRASLGLAKHCTDPQAAIIAMSGKHPDFDLDENMKKMQGWKGTGPTTCGKLEQLCPKGCEGCPNKGKITSPAQLTATMESTVETESGEEVVLKLPDGYVLRNTGISKEVITETETTDGNGNITTGKSISYDHVCAYEMHITGVYNDPESRRSAFKLLIKYPMIGWQEQDHEITVIAATGKDFSSFLLNRQVYVKTIAQQEKLRAYLMDYLTMVQNMSPTGLDYVAFGWQEDGSFLCGETVIGSSTGSTDRRLRGPAARFSEIIKPHGSRDEWIHAMDMLNLPGSQTIRSAVLVATAGILGPIAGNASMVLSIYSTETTTGKSLGLIAANSLIGTPKALFMNKNDTANALFKVRGVLNNLPCTIDELTSAGEQSVVDLAYDLSQGREKLAMTKDRELRTPVHWDGPTLITTNISLHQKFDAVQANNDPLKARTMEIAHHDRTFIKTDETGTSNGYRFYDILAENNGWAFPELVHGVFALGGPKDVWQRGEKAFTKKFNFLFEPQERYYRTAIIGGWIMGSIGKKLGLFPFDVDDTIQHLLAQVVKFRKETVDNKQDVFDTIGQFLQEHNDRLIEVTEVYGAGKEQVRQPAPEKAVARLKIVYDSANPVLPGSLLAINLAAMKSWLAKTKDGVDRITRELETNSALIAARERVTLFKGCVNRNPGQAHCLVVNLHHPRFIASLTGTSARPQSKVALSVLQGAAE